MTEFQEKVTIEFLKRVCKKMHHTLTDEQLDKLQFHFKYTWVCVSFRVKDYGYISFGMDNHAQTQLYGPKVSTADIEDALKRKAINFRIWRFTDDEIYKRERQAEFLLAEEMPRTTVEEFYKNYYKEE